MNIRRRSILGCSRLMPRGSATMVGQEFAVRGADPAGDDVMVHSEVHGGSTPAAKIDWRVREGADGPRIIDVVIEGVSMVVTHRSEFQAIVQRQGIAGLIETLRARAQRASAQPS